MLGARHPSAQVTIVEQLHSRRLRAHNARPPAFFRRTRMNLEQQKERALTFLRGLEKPDASSYQDLLADDFEFKMMGRLPGVAPIRGKDAFLKSTPPMLKAIVPNGLNTSLSPLFPQRPPLPLPAHPTRRP